MGKLFVHYDQIKGQIIQTTKAKLDQGREQELKKIISEANRIKSKWNIDVVEGGLSAAEQLNKYVGGICFV